MASKVISCLRGEAIQSNEDTDVVEFRPAISERPDHLDKVVEEIILELTSIDTLRGSSFPWGVRLNPFMEGGQWSDRCQITDLERTPTKRGSLMIFSDGDRTKGDRSHLFVVSPDGA